MKWRRTHGTDSQGEAVSDCGYRMQWATNTLHGVFYNCWSPEPNSRVLAAGYDKNLVLAACERHAKAAA